MTAYLIARIEAATEGSRELDCVIAVASGEFFIKGEICGEPAYCYIDSDEVLHMPGNGGGAAMVPNYSESVDAALTLVPEGWSHGYRLTTANDDLGSLVEAWVRTKGRMWHGVTHSTPALALCAAALRARSEKERKP